MAVEPIPHDRKRWRDLKGVHVPELRLASRARQAQALGRRRVVVVDSWGQIFFARLRFLTRRAFWQCSTRAKKRIDMESIAKEIRRFATRLF